MLLDWVSTVLIQQNDINIDIVDIIDIIDQPDIAGLLDAWCGACAHHCSSTRSTATSEAPAVAFCSDSSTLGWCHSSR